MNSLFSVPLIELLTRVTSETPAFAGNEDLKSFRGTGDEILV